jgi:hypothetical protein
MIVRDRGDSWQLVMQPDHGDLAEQFVLAWGNDRLAPPARHASAAIAAKRHDDGWAVWERAVALDPRNGRPCNFVDVPIEIHLAFYRACIETVGNQDAYAGLLLSMHCGGLYSGRHGTQPSFSMTFASEAQEPVDQFVAEQAGAQPAMRAALGVSEDEAWTDYKFLQVFDRLSLYFCRMDVENGEPDTIGPVPLGPGGDGEAGDADIRIEPIAPWHVRMDPFPFAQSPARFTLLRRVLPKETWSSDEEFRAAFRAADVERVEITVEGAAPAAAAEAAAEAQHAS